MRTTVIRPADLDFDQQLKCAAEALLQEEVVAFPTETVYGLGALYNKPRAIRKVYEVKGRPSDNPLIVHLSKIEQVYPLVAEVPKLALKLWHEFAPGPLTLIFKRSDKVPDDVTAGLDTVAIRLPAHPLAIRLIDTVGVPLVAPSANRSGRPSPTRAWHVLEDFDGQIPYILDGGPCEHGLESTVLDITGETPTVLRPGAVTREQLSAFLGREVLSFESTGQKLDDKAPRAPGMKYRHYAPKIPVYVLRLDEIEAEKILERPAPRVYLISEHDLPCLRAFESRLLPLPQDVDARLTEDAAYYLTYLDEANAGHALFDFFRKAEAMGAQSLFVEALKAEGYGTAFMNRLLKASYAEKEGL